MGPSTIKYIKGKYAVEHNCCAGLHIFLLCILQYTHNGMEHIKLLAIHNILSTAPQLSISQKALVTLPEDVNVMPKHVGTTIHN
jgi:hypothetical protein